VSENWESEDTKVLILLVALFLLGFGVGGSLFYRTPEVVNQYTIEVPEGNTKVTMLECENEKEFFFE
jgi:hypothetical protein